MAKCFVCSVGLHQAISNALAVAWLLEVKVARSVGAVGLSADVTNDTSQLLAYAHLPH